MNSAYDYLLSVAEGLLKESGLPKEIVQKYFDLKNLTFAGYLKSSGISTARNLGLGLTGQQNNVSASPRKSSDKEKVLTRLISVLQSALSKGDAHPFIQTIREDALQTGEKELIEYVESQMRLMESRSEKKRSKKQSQNKFGEDDLICYHQNVQSQLNALQQQNDQLILEIERLGQLIQQQQQIEYSNSRFEDNTNSNTNIQYEQAELNEFELSQQHQEQQQQWVQQQEQQEESQQFEDQFQNVHGELQQEEGQQLFENQVYQERSVNARPVWDENLISSLRRENESLKSELRQHQQFHMESIRKVMQCMKRGGQATAGSATGQLVEQVNGQVVSSGNVGQMEQQIEGLLVQVEENQNQIRVDDAEKQTILSHMKVFSSKFEKLLQKYISEINTTGKFETDNMWLITKLVELNKQTELLEKSVVLNEKKSFYDDLEQTYIEMKHELQNTVKKQQQNQKLGNSTIHPHQAHLYMQPQ